jgi:peptidoglycan/xylan/chitin deacetylase (PgdA/CDA1 family)
VTLQTTLKRSAYWLADRTGGLRLVGRLTRRLPRILMYHRFSQGPRWRAMDVAVFARQMRYLRENFQPVSMDDVAAHLNGSRPLPDRAVVVTVDDGFEDFYTLALPVLRRYAIPAVLYLPTDFVDRRCVLWPDRLYAMLLRAHAGEVLVPGPDGTPRRQVLATIADRREAWTALADDLVERAEYERNSALAELALSLGVVDESPLPEDRPMTWDQVRAAAAANVTIGSQTVTHPSMARETAETQARQSRESKARLEAMLKREVRHFSYPHGRQVDFDETTMAVVREAGYATAVAAFADDVPLPGPYAIRRFGASTDPLEFRKVAWGMPLIRATHGITLPEETG